MDETPLRRAPSRARAVVLGLLGIAVLALFYVGLMRPEWQRDRRAENERSAASAIHYLSAVEAMIKAHDLDGNGAADFWTGDIAGMAKLFPANGPAAAFLTPLGYKDVPASLMDIAQADPSRSDAKPYRGYWFVPLDSDVDGNPFRQNGRPHHPNSFGYCAFPAEAGVTGNNTFLINEGGTVFQSHTGTRTTKMPSDRELQLGWSKVG